ncbi:hypothetical protein CBS147343_10863 [Aspergillus niger]|nr:hypothetical protein CBS11350_10473 [Aspergillus niger]KAI2853627.1 hypothetical protein CBS12448_8035 [Aspergillus niger]KAI2890670.1 hypothetical protein CBS11852_6344 [Aspergillus niger]KAI2929060.1 hypothetical protein CBS147320_3938 [Aspergillus niger]KAI2944710.1 hypothetical protein CBS147322_7996 [Aspergillus niger]
MSAIQLVSTELEKSGWESEELLNKAQILMNQELAWLAKASYSIASKVFRATSLEPVMHLLDISIKFAETCQHPDIKQHIVLSEHYLLCDSLKIARITIEARKEIGAAEKQRHYSAIRRISTHFREQFKSQQIENSRNNPRYERFLSQHRTIFALDLEASTFLNDWTGVCTIVEESSPSIDEKLSSVFLDRILRSDAQLKPKVQAVKTLIRTLHASPSPFLDKSTFIVKSLPRYIRCLFQLSLDAAEYQLAESILDQALILAQGKQTETGNDNKRSLSGYPEDEIRWLSTVAFNRAVDYYLAAADMHCRRWAGKAISLADLVEDDGALGRLLRGKLEMLT